MRLSSVPTAQLMSRAETFREIDAVLGDCQSDLVGIFEELVDRRAEEESELRQMERSQAYEGASSLIDGCCACVAGELAEWRDADSKVEGSEEAVDAAIRYLDLRGLIERDPERPNIISIRNESEATR